MVKWWRCWRCVLSALCVKGPDLLSGLSLFSDPAAGKIRTSGGGNEAIKTKNCHRSDLHLQDISRRTLVLFAPHL